MGRAGRRLGACEVRYKRSQSQDLLTDLQGTLAEGLCLPVPPTLSVEDSQVVQGGSHLGGAAGQG